MTETDDRVLQERVLSWDHAGHYDVLSFSFSSPEKYTHTHKKKNGMKDYSGGGGLLV